MINILIYIAIAIVIAIEIGIVIEGGKPGGRAPDIVRNQPLPGKAMDQNWKRTPIRRLCRSISRSTGRPSISASRSTGAK